VKKNSAKQKTNKQTEKEKEEKRTRNKHEAKKQQNNTNLVGKVTISCNSISTEDDPLNLSSLHERGSHVIANKSIRDAFFLMHE
jgi:hypothetical protein